MGLARLIRGQVLSLREREFIQAAEVIGVPDPAHPLQGAAAEPGGADRRRDLARRCPGFVAAEARPVVPRPRPHRHPVARQDGRRRDVDYYADYPLYLWMPVATIALLTLSLNLLGDSIRDAFDPKTRR